MKKEVKRAIILIIIVGLIVVGIKGIQGFDKTKKDLKKHGYSKEEISLIVEKIDKAKIKDILAIEYSDKLDDILKETYYIPDHLMDYLNLSKTNNNINEVVSKVNVNSYKDWYTDAVKTKVDENLKMLVNKFNYLDETYKPNDIVNIPEEYAYANHKIKEEVYSQYKKMWKEAKKEGLTLIVTSSYRDFDEQKKEYDAANDDYAAKPGFSEHQTGLALDIVTYDTQGNDFENKKEFLWLQDNADKYGFILRYPKDKENITGYAYESWHYRYVGTTLASKVKTSNLTFDEYHAYFCDYKKEC
ncbi:MAG: M15 family metallopeptidase [Bacilli bacterium]